MYSIRIEDSNSLIRIERKAFIPADKTGPYINEIMETTKLARGRLSTVHVLIILPGEDAVQSAETAQKLKGMAALFEPSEHEKIAVVLHSPLAAMQNKRIAGSHRMSVFDSEDKARKWLREDSV